jgi:hypothetical protein
MCIFRVFSPDKQGLLAATPLMAMQLRPIFVLKRFQMDYAVRRTNMLLPGLYRATGAVYNCLLVHLLFTEEWVRDA